MSFTPDERDKQTKNDKNIRKLVQFKNIPEKTIIKIFRKFGEK